MTILLVLLLLALLIFGGLGVFVAKAFLVVFLLALLAALVLGGVSFNRRGRA